MKKLINGLVMAGVMCGLTGVAFAEAPKSYATKCATCHGKDGKGQTKMGKKLGIKDLTDPKVQDAFTDEQALKDLTDGVKDKDGKELMEPYKDKLTVDELKALIAYIRTFKAK